VIPYFQLPSLRLGPFTLQVFGLFAAAGVYLAARLSARAASRGGLDTRPLLDFAVWGVGAGVVGGHLVHLFLYHPEELQDPARIFKVWEGLSSFGGLLGAVIAAFVFFRRLGVRFHDYGDAFALGVAPGWGVARLGCFSIHDHPGVVTHFPLAVKNWPPLAMKDWPAHATRHDLGLYDALALYAIAGLLYFLARRRILQERLLAVLALLYGVCRFLLDFLRASNIDYADARYFGLTPAQYFCFGLIVYAIWRFSAERTALRRGAPNR
jgi:phosphatidylglycerol---prolipoprotein diacylglyceryl transferase